MLSSRSLGLCRLERLVDRYLANLGVLQLAFGVSVVRFVETADAALPYAEIQAVSVPEKGLDFCSS